MLDWIFGSSKEQKKQQFHPEDKLSEDEAWVYDFIRQYLLSPIWKNPLLDFIQQNCTSFQDTEENKFQYTKIFQEFTSLCSILIESIVEETGITFKTLEKCIVKGLKSSQDKKIFTQILICDNFLTFKRIMISKNKELEVEALKQIRTQSKKEDKVQDLIDEAEREKLDIEQAIALSLALEEKAKQQEEEQFQQAIRQSQISVKQQKNIEQKKSLPEVKPPRKSILGQLPPLILPERKFETQAEYTQEKIRLDKQIQQLKAHHKTQQDSAERKKRLLEQRQMLKKKKQEQRQIELKTFVQNKQGSQQNISGNTVSEEELARRKKLMNRLKQQLKND